MWERRALKRNAASIFVAVLVWMFLRTILSGMILSGVRILLGMLRITVTPAHAALIYSATDVLTTLVSMGLPFFIMIKVIDIPLGKALPFHVIRTGFDVGSLFIALAASVIGVYTGSALASAAASGGMSPTPPAFDLPTDAPSAVFYILSIVIVPAFLEEMVFRGAILQPLRRFGDGLAIVASAAIFSLAHLNLYQIPNAFIMGLLMGYFVVRSGSLWAGVAIHLVNNGVAALFEFISSRIPTRLSYAMTLMLYIVYLLVGLTALIVSSRRQKRMFMVRAPQRVLTSPELSRCYFTSASTVALFIVLAAMTVYATL